MENGLTYIRVGDYYIPNLALDPEPEEPARDIGKYGHMRLTYLKQHRRKLYRELVSTSKLQAHLLDINDTANEWLDQMMPQMAKAAGATEELKARDQMAWVGLMCQRHFKMSFFAEMGCRFLQGSMQVLYSLIHHITCRLEARRALIYQLVSGLTGESGKYNYSKAVHLYPPFFDIFCSPKNYKTASALT